MPETDKAAVDAYRERTQAAFAFELVYLLVFAGSIFACAAASRRSR